MNALWKAGTIHKQAGISHIGLMFILQRIQHVETVSFVICDFTGIEDAFKRRSWISTQRIWFWNSTKASISRA